MHHLYPHKKEHNNTKHLINPNSHPHTNKVKAGRNNNKDLQAQNKKAQFENC